MLETSAALETMRSAGMRRTPQRRAVVRALEGNSSHPRADEVLSLARRDVPDISSSTVYKVLGELEELGLVASFPTPDGLRYDPDTGEHAHVVCDACAGLFDLDPGPASSEARRQAEREGFTVRTSTVEVRGLCPACVEPGGAKR
jgi:Fur family peroxide stress response transcriptional regulator